VSGWIRLQNGYYLPLQSDDGTVRFLQKLSVEFNPSNGEKRKLGASSPLFRLPGNPSADGVALSQLKKSEVSMQEFSSADFKEMEPLVQDRSDEKPLERVRAAIHMDAVSNCLLCKYVPIVPSFKIMPFSIQLLIYIFFFRWHLEWGAAAYKLPFRLKILMSLDTFLINSLY
jgi:hypothetical protein